jgi:sugar phosphate isomerase/epimerase
MIEFMVFRGIATLDDAMRVVGLAGHPNLGICVDALHLQRSGGTPESVSRIDSRLISCVQLCDAPAAAPAPQDIPREARYGRLYPGEGALPLRELLAVVPAGHPLSIEVPCAAPKLSVAERADKAARCTRALIAAVHGGGDKS